MEGNSKEMDCKYHNREYFIEGYLLDTLTEAERDEFADHLFDCEACQKELHFREALKETVVREADGQRTDGGVATSSRWKLGGYAAAAMAAILLGILGIYRFSLPQFYEPAGLTAAEAKDLASATRGNDAEALNDFAKGAKALLNASQKHFGIFPYFDEMQVDAAIKHFHAAFENSSELFDKNQYAYFLGKAYLMKAQPDSARQWLEKVIHSNAVNYQPEAKILLETLE